jgi:hypothetical protein
MNILVYLDDELQQDVVYANTSTNVVKIHTPGGVVVKRGHVDVMFNAIKRNTVLEGDTKIVEETNLS